MLISTALCITPAPYAGTNRVRFNGFAGLGSSDIPHLRPPKDHPKVRVKCSLPWRCVQNCAIAAAAQAGESRANFSGGCVHAASASAAIRRPSSSMPTARATRRCPPSRASFRTPKPLSCAPPTQRITTSGCVSSMRARRRRSSGTRPSRPTPCCSPSGGAARLRCARPAAPASSRSACAATRAPQSRHRVSADDARIGQPAAVQDDPAGRRGTQASGDVPARGHARPHRAQRQQPAARADRRCARAGSPGAQCSKP